MSVQRYGELLKRAIDYMEKHIEEELTLEEVASYCAMSMYHFHRVFQDNIGMSVNSYIRKRRLTYAAQALVMTNRSVLDIAVQYGFSSQEAFTRAFKGMFHLPPKRYRTYFQSFYIEREGVSMQKGLPKGWVLSGSHPGEYEMGIDYEIVHQGKTSAAQINIGNSIDCTSFTFTSFTFIHKSSAHFFRFGEQLFLKLMGMYGEVYYEIL